MLDDLENDEVDAFGRSYHDAPRTAGRDKSGSPHRSRRGGGDESQLPENTTIRKAFRERDRQIARESPSPE